MDATTDLIPDPGLRIGGAARAARAGGSFEVIDPSRRVALTRVADASPDDVDDAVAVARRAFLESDWASRPAHERGAVLVRLAALIRDRSEPLAELESRSNGAPITESRAQVAAAATIFEFFGGLAPSVIGTMPNAGAAVLDLVTVEPFGVCGLITPFNAPIFTMAMKAAPALAVGNAVVVKPSPLTPLTTLAVADLAQTAGIPDGIVNVIPSQSVETGAALVAHRDVPRISFTGSTPVGQSIHASAAALTKRVTLELGGKSATLVCEDADPATVVQESAYASVFRSSGQLCTHRSRIFVPRSMLDRFVDLYVERVRSFRIGDPLDPSTEIGPLASDHHRNRVEAMVRDAARRLEPVIGGQRAVVEGLPDAAFFQPTVFVDPPADLSIMREEIFGPVACIVGYEHLDDAIGQANDTDYGLTASIWSSDVGAALRIASRLQAGNVSINQASVIAPWAPFGGHKQSGIGVELGLEALRDCVQLKNVMVKLPG